MAFGTDQAPARKPRCWLSPDRLRGLASLVAVAALWQFLAVYVIRNDLVFAPLTAIVARAVALAQTGALWTNIRVSGTEFLLGYCAAALLGAALGVALALDRALAKYVEPWMGALYATPMIALAPIFVVTMGIGIYSKVAIIFIEAFFPVAVNTTLGVRSTSADLVEAARAFGAGRSQMIRTVYLPNATPFLVAGLRIAVARALAGVLISEIFGSEAGVGNMIWFSAESYDMPTLFTGVFILAGSSILLMSLLARVEARVAHWRT